MKMMAGIGLILGVLVTYGGVLLLIWMRKKLKEVDSDFESYNVINVIGIIIFGLMAIIASLISLLKG